MKKMRLGSLLLLTTLSTFLFSQNLKKNPPTPGGPIDPSKTKLSWPSKIKVPPAEDPFNLGEINYQPIGRLERPEAGFSTVKIIRGENGLPILMKGKTAASAPGTAAKTVGERGLDYLASLAPEAISNPSEEFQATRTESDEQGRSHVRLQQVYKGVPVFGGEVIVHARAGVFEMMNGRYFPTPKLASVEPKISGEEAFQKTVESLGKDKVKLKWTAEELRLVGGQNFETELVVYHAGDNFESEKLAWHVTMHPNLLHRFVFFVDATTGEILNEIDFTCKIDGGRLEGSHVHDCTDFSKENLTETIENQAAMPPPVTGTGLDLANVNRTFGAWQQGTKFYMQDASKPMFNAGASQMPAKPIGAIVTYDAFNTSPESQFSFNYDVVQSTSTTFNNKAGVSAHYNSILSFDYFKNTFNRNSINGSGGNIEAFVNVSESNGASMGNAFWNGDAMWYGNGDSFFKELARGLDVGGHEMTHGVVEKTANLVYQDEPGALNESFADIFGAMIDRDDWKIGEDVMKPGVSPGNALRSLEDPHNNANSSSPFWQPKHMSEKYNGNEDNGGVHINSGIPNHAYYLFATNAAVGKNKAEQVFYKALRDYLVKSSKFIDCRIAVIQASNDLYGASVANAAAAAFDAVGITGSQPGGNYQGQLAVNPGDDYILCVSTDYQNLDLAQGDGQLLGTLYDQGLQSRPSVTDDGLQFVFVNAEGHIIGVDLEYTPTTINPKFVQVSDDPVWRNVAISKDGRFIAGITDNYDNRIYIQDFLLGDQATFILENPTYSQQGQATSDVRFADVLEFDYSGNNLMYDAYNEFANNQGDTISYWDISILHFWENGNFTDGEGDIANLFNGLPEETSVGNPTFAKNSPFVIAFDYIDDLNGRYDVLGVNLETGDVGTIVADNGDLGWPNYNRLDNAIVYESEFLIFGKDLYLQGVSSSKITAQGNESNFINDHVWGVWYANGKRSLQVDATEPGLKISLNVAPNPASDLLQVNFESRSSMPAQASVVNLLGQTMSAKQVQIEAGKNSFDLPLQAIPAGTYFLRLQVGNSVSTVKFLKQ